MSFVFGVYMFIFACVFAFLCGYSVDRSKMYIPFGLSAFVCAIFSFLILGGII